MRFELKYNTSLEQCIYSDSMCWGPTCGRLREDNDQCKSHTAPNYILGHKKTHHVLIKTKPLNRQTVISVNQLFKVHEHMPQPWPPLINGLVDDALLELSWDRN